MTMVMEKNIPLLEEILGNWKNELGNDYEGYKNHVYRMINFCFALHDYTAEERDKIIIAGCFHDLGIWSDKTFDYLPPSIVLAGEYLRQNKLENWFPEIELMIGMHHKLRNYRETEPLLVETFRQGDLVDFSLGFVRCGLPKSYIKNVKKQFPNAGFHKCLVRTASKWFLQHPLNPVPVLKW